MINEKKLFTCRGGNLSIRLYSDRMMIYSARWMSPRSYELPIDRIRTVVVERKSVIPFATATVLAAVSAVVAKYNALWFIINLTPENMTRISTIAFGLMVLCAIPAMSRALFVSVAISWDGQPASFRARFVPARQGRGLAAKFQAISLES